LFEGTKPQEALRGDGTAINIIVPFVVNTSLRTRTGEAWKFS